MTGPFAQNNRGVSNAPSFGGGRTDWAGMGIDEIIDTLRTMEPGQAAGDVETILKAIDAVRRASERMAAMFGDDLRGLASDTALEAGKLLSDAMQRSLETATVVGEALSSAVGIVGATRGQEGRLRELQQHLRDNPEDAPTVRFEADRTMSGTYSSPMQRVQHSLPEPTGPDDMVRGVGGMSAAGVGSGSGSEAPRGQAANTVDAGDFGRSGGGAIPVATTGAAPGPAGGGPTPVTPVSSSSSSSGSSGRGGADDPDGLLRGGRGTPGSGTHGLADSGRSGTGNESRSGGAGSGSGLGPVPSPVVGPLPLSTSAPGVATPTASTPPAASAAAPRAGITPPVGPAGAPPTGRRPGAENDDQHKAAPYLHNREHGAEIVGDLPLVGPPVIGDWIPRPASPLSETPAFRPTPGEVLTPPDRSPGTPDTRADGGDEPSSNTRGRTC
ncbi:MULTISPECIES: hypothetical protein [Gordonia]|uniref:Uncharacterized protein n=1 Tax=Gordonia alkanivorans CGMCC 6845 TaxID=1423140 RepID=W9DM91_9ACTN|nr:MULTISPECIES: hypothetical protein [Gordonia]ETA08806.1 hypothetical protein V525_01525 [Gordonia alkanivorans CGMCC 6845]MDH3010233.1 hypothetical protein [Gordonia alkanivorans]MDH3023104.1 hypothetical protein [Gordonia alkanivorans]MDH3039496.1 hypothetical protein [Gordonia alkanivorans]MDH3047413.1 hypothetical protein [Gordonia alkanivorans]